MLAAGLLLWGWRALVPMILAATVSVLLSPAGAEPLWRVLLVSVVLKFVYWLGTRTLRKTGFDRDFSTTADVALFAGVFAATAAPPPGIAVLDWKATPSARNPGALHLLRSFWVGDVVAWFAITAAIPPIAPWP